MEIYSIRQGEALELAVTLQDDQGNPIANYTGQEPLTAPVWPGGNLPASTHASATWSDPPRGGIALAVSAAQTAALAEGRYFGTVGLVDASGTPLEAYKWAMDVLPAPGSAVLPPSYCGFKDLLKYGRAWLRTLQTPDDEAGFAEQCGRARSWLDDWIIARYPNAVYVTLGDPGYGSTAWGVGPGYLPNQWLRGILDRGGLVPRDWVVEATARHALCLICEDQVGPDERGRAFELLGRKYRTRASNIALAHTAELITNPGVGTVPNLAIPLGSASVRYR